MNEVGVRVKIYVKGNGEKRSEDQAREGQEEEEWRKQEMKG